MHHWAELGSVFLLLKSSKVVSLSCAHPVSQILHPAGVVRHIHGYLQTLRPLLRARSLPLSSHSACPGFSQLSVCGWKWSQFLFFVPRGNLNKNHRRCFSSLNRKKYFSNITLRDLSRLVTHLIENRMPQIFLINDFRRTCHGFFNHCASLALVNWYVLLILLIVASL